MYNAAKSSVMFFNFLKAKDIFYITTIHMLRIIFNHICLTVAQCVCTSLWAVITARKRTLGHGNIFRSVCQEFCPRGGGLPQRMLRYHPLGTKQAPPPRDQAGTPPGPGRPPPREQSMLGDMVNEQAKCILLECNLVPK